jgi:hypothetical protein
VDQVRRRVLSDVAGAPGRADAAAVGGDEVACDARERRLAGAVLAHEHRDGAGGEVGARVDEHVGAAEPLPHAPHRERGRRGSRARQRGGRRPRRSELARLPDRERQRVDAGGRERPRDRRQQVAACGRQRRGRQARWGVDLHTPVRHGDDPVDLGEDPPGAVLCQHDRHAAVPVQAHQQAEQLLRRDRVELARRLVQQQQARAGRQHRGDRDALRLAAGERLGLAPGEVRDARQHQRLLRPQRDLGRVRGEVLQPERGLAIDPAEHDLGLRILEHEPGAAGDLAGAGHPRVESRGHHLAGELAPVEVGDQPERRAQQRRLAAARVAGEQHQLALGDLERHTVQRRRAAARVAVGDLVQRQRAHRITTVAAPSAAPTAAASASAGPLVGSWVSG